MQIPILTGVIADESANLNYTYPVNMIPVVMKSGISAGYLRTADGAVSLGASSGVPRGGINWNGELYRVAGTKLVKVDQFGVETVLGDVGAGPQVTLGYSADRLAVASNGNFYYWNGITLDQVIDPDLGTVLAFVWVDGYFVTTDGEFLIVTELSDPTQVNPLKYGSSEIDPDPIVTVLKVRNEVVAVNRYTIEFFNNIGGNLFPFQRIEGAQLQKGAIGRHCACTFADTVAFLGSGRNETPAIYMGLNGTLKKISTAAIDTLLAEYGEVDLAEVILEEHDYQSHPQLWVRLPDRTIAFDLDASQETLEASWFVLTSAAIGFSQYRVVDPVWCYDKWTVCDSVTGDHGVMTDDSAHHFGTVVRWEFSTIIVYNGGKGLLWNQLELVCLTGRVTLGDDPVISTNYTLDGERWSEERPIRAGITGDRMRRLVWFQQGHMRNWRAQRFSGDSRARLSAVRLEVQVEPLNV
jgi:hypothetical protein